jgi:uncharacterized membrane protein
MKKLTIKKEKEEEEMNIMWAIVVVIMVLSILLFRHFLRGVEEMGGGPKSDEAVWILVDRLTLPMN